MSVIDEGRTADFTEHRELLFGIVYHMLGTVADTEDVLQEVWLHYAAAPRDGVANPRAYLVRAAVNQAVDRLRRVRRRRESYVGPWLPEPLVTEREDDPADRAERVESISLALMVVLEALTPLERAVFVLREAFGYEHDEIARLLGRTPAAVRQLSHRARSHVQANRPRYRPSPGVHRQVTERFLTAALTGDVRTLVEVLAPDVALWTDGGGKRSVALRVIEGRDKVLRVASAGGPKVPRQLTARYLRLNGDPAALVYDGDVLYGVLIVELGDDDRIRAVYTIMNPDKLRNVHTPVE